MTGEHDIRQIRMLPLPEERNRLRDCATLSMCNGLGRNSPIVDRPGKPAQFVERRPTIRERSVKKVKEGYLDTHFSTS